VFYHLVLKFLGGVMYRKQEIIKDFSIFLLPTLFLYVFVVVYPVLDTFSLGFFSWDGLTLRKFIGLSNYIEISLDPIFWKSLWNNIFWIIISIINPMVVGLVIAVFLSQIELGRKIYLVIIYIPVVLSLVVVGLVWGLMYNPIVGPVNVFLTKIGRSELVRGWLGDNRFVNLAVILAGNWTYFGFCTVIFLAGLQGINPSIIESAIIDGAGPVRRFFRIIIPCLSDQINLVVVNSIIGSFKIFDIVYVMTNGGPNHASEVIATYMYWQAFKNGRVGYGSSLATILTVFVGVFSIVYLRKRESVR
jgi:ABC-type sugar transport system permease subunit